MTGWYQPRHNQVLPSKCMHKKNTHNIESEIISILLEDLSRHMVECRAAQEAGTQHL